MAPDSNTNTSLYKIISGALKMPSVLFTQRKDDRARWIYDANILQQISFTDIDGRAEGHFSNHLQLFSYSIISPL